MRREIEWSDNGEKGCYWKKEENGMKYGQNGVERKRDEDRIISQNHGIELEMELSGWNHKPKDGIELEMEL